jgi:hypothetical protein
MSDNCTIICADADYQAAFNSLRAVSPLPLAIEGNQDAWSRIEIRSPTSSIAFTSLVRKAPMDPFSKLNLSLSNFFRRIETPHEELRQKIVAHINNATLMIVVVAEPEFSEQDLHPEFIYSLAQTLNGMVFDGDAMHDDEGEILLDQRGESDVA